MDKGLKLILFLFMLPLAVATAASKKPISEKQMSAYLMVFHRDNTHSLYMALSRDGYHFTALNNAQPVISGDTIFDQPKHGAVGQITEKEAKRVAKAQK